MRKIRYPSYYKDFKCIASACTDSCCEGWGIDIDSDSLSYYKTVTGEFGERLKNSISWEEIEDNPHFIINEQHRCPFLNEQNLCDLYINLGEEHLCQICTDHPRYYEWISTITEAGVGLCCEEAIRLVLSQKGKPSFYEMEEESFSQDSDVLDLEEMSSECFEDNLELEEKLFHMRDEVFGIINDQSQPLTERMNALFRLAPGLQTELDDLLYPMIEEDEDEYYDEDEQWENEEEVAKVEWTDHFWNPENLQELLDHHLSLEINDPQWKERLLHLRSNLEKILDQRDAFMDYYQSNLEEYVQLMNYFIYRYFMKARLDEAVDEKIYFTLLCVSMILLLSVDSWSSLGELSPWQQLLNVKLYSKEIEYNETNVEELSVFIV